MAEPFHINDDWRIESDPECWVLRRLVRDKKGKPGRRKNRTTGKMEDSWVIEGYYVQLEQLFKGFQDKQTRLSDKTLPAALLEASKVLTTASHEFRRALKEAQDA